MIKPLGLNFFLILKIFGILLAMLILLGLIAYFGSKWMDRF